MKRVTLILLPCIFFIIQLSNAQSTGIRAKVVFVDSLVKTAQYRETGLRIVLFNTSGRDPYIPNLLVPFEQQVTDSLFIYKLQNGKYTPVTKLSGVRKGDFPAYLHGPTIHLVKQFYTGYQKKKKFSDSIVTGLSKLSGKSSINALFLAVQERFSLYQISPAGHLINQPGDYRIDFKFGKRQSGTLPAEISGFQLFSPGEIPVEPVYISVEALRSGKRVVVKDSKQQKIRSFVWKY